MVTWRECSTCKAIIGEQNVNGLCRKCLLIQRAKEKEEKRVFNKLDKEVRSVLAYLYKFILNPTDKIIADQSRAWDADERAVKNNLHLMKYGKNEQLNYYYTQFTGRSWRKKLDK